ncbi:ostA-like family protein [Cyanobacteria bacterium FACHB-63]|nr:ostA-like family protein [Cyanobacteria bacterium FACHB-63]
MQSSAMLRLRSLFFLPILAASVIAAGSSSAQAPAASSTPLTLRANTTEANAKTGVVVAKGNVQINYPARQIQATSAQAIYYSNERRIVLSGDVYVLQQGNSLRGEVITYLVDEGRFVALPQPNKQVEAIYLIEAPATPAQPAPATPAPFSPRPQFQSKNR